VLLERRLHGRERRRKIGARAQLGDAPLVLA